MISQSHFHLILNAILASTTTNVIRSSDFSISDISKFIILFFNIYSSTLNNQYVKPLLTLAIFIQCYSAASAFNQDSTLKFYCVGVVTTRVLIALSFLNQRNKLQIITFLLKILSITPYACLGFTTDRSKDIYIWTSAFTFDIIEPILLNFIQKLLKIDTNTLVNNRDLNSMQFYTIVLSSQLAFQLFERHLGVSDSFGILTFNIWRISLAISGLIILISIGLLLTRTASYTLDETPFHLKYTWKLVYFGLHAQIAITATFMSSIIEYESLLVRDGGTGLLYRQEQPYSSLPLWDTSFNSTANFIYNQPLDFLTASYSDLKTRQQNSKFLSSSTKKSPSPSTLHLYISILLVISIILLLLEISMTNKLLKTIQQDYDCRYRVLLIRSVFATVFFGIYFANLNGFTSILICTNLLILLVILEFFVEILKQRTKPLAVPSDEFNLV